MSSTVHPVKLKLPTRFAFVTGFVLLWVLVASAQDPATLSIEQLRNGIENRHPSSFYILAEKLFAAGKKEEAVFWFYAGQSLIRLFHTVENNGSCEMDPEVGGLTCFDYGCINSVNISDLSLVVPLNLTAPLT